jgi:small subunit ribosomal protein S8
MSVADLVIRIKNGYMARKDVIIASYSKMNLAILTKLQKMKYIEDFKVEGEAVKEISVTLRYEDGVPAMTDVKIFSTPGRRWYTSYTEIRPVLGGMGHAVVSSSKGIMTGFEARKEKVGGELLFQIW